MTNPPETPGRVWDRFLTPQDRALASLHERPAGGLGARPALVLIDVYRRAFGERPLPVLEAIVEAPGSCGLAAWDALPRLERLLHGARAAGLLVVHVTADADLPGWRAPRGGSPQSHAEKVRGYEIMEAVAPLDDELVIRKVSPSAFFGTVLGAVLRQHGADGVIVAGESTSGCVRATVVDARSERFEVTVVEDGVFDRTEAAHALNLFDMAQKYADVRLVDDVLAELAQRRPASLEPAG